MTQFDLGGRRLNLLASGRVVNLARMSAAEPREVLPLVTQFDLGERHLNLLASGRVVNLAAGQGHPAAVMDMSFANQVLAVEHLVAHGAELGAGVHPVPEAVDREVARLKLASLGVRDRRALRRAGAYLRGWLGS